MKQQQQQSVFPQQPSQPVSQPTSTVQQQIVAQSQPPQTKAISKPIPAGIEIIIFEFPKHDFDFHLLTTDVNAKYYC